jgi:hypothetical protein
MEMIYSRWIIIYAFITALSGRETIGAGLYEEELIEFLRDNYKPNSTLSYTGAREALYEYIDNEGNYVSGIYTNYSVYLPPGTNAPTTYLYENGMDCEHVWPQSMYDGDDCPMRCDLHHLRPSKANVNQSRSNKPFGEIPDHQTDNWYWLDQNQSSIPNNNIDEYSESKSGCFEPREDRKGDIARTMFYFYTMYSESADADFFASQKEELNNWHEYDSADENEIYRTWQIASYQQNKPNPFILDETLVWRAFFYEDIVVGDINGDGLLNILDIVGLVNVILGESEATPVCDLNEDGSYNVLDVVILANLILSQF